MIQAQSSCCSLNELAFMFSSKRLQMAQQFLMCFVQVLLCPLMFRALVSILALPAFVICTPLRSALGFFGLFLRSYNSSYTPFECTVSNPLAAARRRCVCQFPPPERQENSGASSQTRLLLQRKHQDPYPPLRASEANFLLYRKANLLDYLHPPG